eukprot:365161-Chlamydomonas_euryale.AAC.3
MAINTHLHVSRMCGRQSSRMSCHIAPPPLPPPRHCHVFLTACLNVHLPAYPSTCHLTICPHIHTHLHMPCVARYSSWSSPFRKSVYTSLHMPCVARNAP